MNVVRMMKEDEQKKILLNYIYLSRQHAGGKDQVAINLLEGICKIKTWVRALCCAMTMQRLIWSRLHPE